VESAPAAGTTFRIRLPAGTINESAAAKQVAGEQGTQCEVNGSVLVIDDDPGAQGLRMAHLIKAGYLVTVAPVGEAGLDLARRLRPDFITLDVIMPRIDGWSVLAALKADPAHSSVPVTVVSMVGD